mmetsp:Transcript_11321/g.17886  ORF Transcript_11321/g.17886 Transcript_11321/m.17886 type:complete len:221 (+) Transcript_11321:1112-1774(+)
MIFRALGGYTPLRVIILPLSVGSYKRKGVRVDRCVVALRHGEIHPETSSCSDVPSSHVIVLLVEGRPKVKLVLLKLVIRVVLEAAINTAVEGRHRSRIVCSHPRLEASPFSNSHSHSHPHGAYGRPHGAHFRRHKTPGAERGNGRYAPHSAGKWFGSRNTHGYAWVAFHFHTATCAWTTGKSTMALLVLLMRREADASTAVCVLIDRREDIPSLRRPGLG